MRAAGVIDPQATNACEPQKQQDQGTKRQVARSSYVLVFDDVDAAITLEDDAEGW